MLDGVRQACRVFEDQLERCQLTLPVMPGVASQVLEMAMDEDADASSLAALIENDMALAGHIMRVANSAAFRPVSPFVSLQQVIARMGMSTISEMALATALNTDLFAAPGSETLLTESWRDSLLTCAWAREIARHRRTNVEMGFLGGLLARIGLPVAIQGLVAAGMPGSLVSEFAETYEVRAGALLSKAWALPESVQQCVLHHGEPASASVHQDEVLNVALALTFVHGGQGMVPDPELAAVAGLYPEDFEVICDKAEYIEQWVTALAGDVGA